MNAMIADGDSVAVLCFRRAVWLPRPASHYSARLAQWFTFAGGKISRI